MVSVASWFASLFLFSLLVRRIQKPMPLLAEWWQVHTNDTGTSEAALTTKTWWKQVCPVFQYQTLQRSRSTFDPGLWIVSVHAKQIELQFLYINWRGQCTQITKKAFLLTYSLMHLDSQTALGLFAQIRRYLPPLWSKELLCFHPPECRCQKLGKKMNWEQNVTKYNNGNRLEVKHGKFDLDLRNAHISVQQWGDHH